MTRFIDRLVLVVASWYLHHHVLEEIHAISPSAMM